MKMLREKPISLNLLNIISVTLISACAIGLFLPHAAFAEEARGAARRRSDPRIEFKDARIKFEVNDTDGDGGIQIFLDSDEWKSIDIFDPEGRKIFRTRTGGSIAKQGGTELFLESAEPDFSEFPLEQLLMRFPEGRYRFRGKGLEGERIIGSAQLTHNIPDGPQLVYPLEEQNIDPNSLTVQWQPVDAVNGSAIVAYQVLVVQIESDFAAVPKVALDIIMPATATSLAVPPGFLLPNTEYEWEVLAIEESGNQTLSSSSFKTSL